MESPKKKGGCLKYALYAVVAFIGLGVLGAIISPNENSSGSTTTQAKERDDAPAEPPKFESPWQYSEGEDRMSGDKSFYAQTSSSNEVDFEFPYHGGSTLSLTVRNSKGRNEVLVRISSGQFMTSISGDEHIRIKVDDNQPKNYSYNGAADGSTDVIFVNSANRFIADLKGASELMVEAPFYNEGRQIFDFEVDSLNWDY